MFFIRISSILIAGLVLNSCRTNRDGSSSLEGSPQAVQIDAEVARIPSPNKKITDCKSQLNDRFVLVQVKRYGSRETPQAVAYYQQKGRDLAKFDCTYGEGRDSDGYDPVGDRDLRTYAWYCNNVSDSNEFAKIYVGDVSIWITTKHDIFTGRLGDTRGFSCRLGQIDPFF